MPEQSQSTENQAQAATVAAGSSKVSPPATNGTQDWPRSVFPLRQSPHSGEWIDDEYYQYLSDRPPNGLHATHHKRVKDDFCSALNKRATENSSELETAAKTVAFGLTKSSTVASALNVTFDSKSSTLTLDVRDDKSSAILGIQNSTASALKPLRRHLAHMNDAAAYQGAFGP